MISKDEEIKATQVYIGFLILKILKNAKEDKISIFELTEKLKKHLQVVHYRQLILAMAFLFSAGIIDFSDPYIYKI